ncbi:hypothetical protein SESBI_22443 [Sesbania bispinosa]|nr:hypothetical protein SESBI_22443 [Sesbania bispinosa]
MTLPARTITIERHPRHDFMPIWNPIIAASGSVVVLEHANRSGVAVQAGMIPNRPKKIGDCKEETGEAKEDTGMDEDEGSARRKR